MTVRSSALLLRGAAVLGLFQSQKVEDSGCEADRETRVGCVVQGDVFGMGAADVEEISEVVKLPLGSERLIVAVRHVGFFKDATDEASVALVSYLV